MRKVDTSGILTTFATYANFCDLAGKTTDSANNLYVADDCASAIFKITPAGLVSVVAGVPFTPWKPEVKHIHFVRRRGSASMWASTHQASGRS